MTSLARRFFSVAAVGVLAVAAACASSPPPDTRADDALAAAGHGKTGALVKLLESGVSPDVVDGNGNTPLILAVREGHADTVEALLRFRPQVDRRNRNGDNALMLASLRGDETTVDRLLAAGARVNGNSGAHAWTPLHYAALEGKLGVLERLLAAGADVNALSPNQSDALMLASRNGHIDIVRRLLQTPISLDRRNDRGVDAEAWARSKGNTKIADLIKKARSQRQPRG